MRITDLTGKEVINIGDGSRMGVIDECELIFEGKSGRIQALLLPGRSGFLGFFSDSRNASIPWNAIKRIGDEVIIVDLNNAFERFGLRRERLEDAY